MSTTQKDFENLLTHLDYYLGVALKMSQELQSRVHNSEGDTDLYRKLSVYLTPNLIHWISGQQAGSMKDLKETLDRRLTEQGNNMAQLHEGEGQDVLTKPKA